MQHPIISSPRGFCHFMLPNEYYAMEALFFISLCCSTFHRIGVFRLLTYFKTAVCFISEFLFMTKQFCRCYSIMSTYSPEGKATVTRKAMTKSHGQLMWRPTLPGCGSTWASLAGSCTTGKTPT